MKLTMCVNVLVCACVYDHVRILFGGGAHVASIKGVCAHVMSSMCGVTCAV